MFDIGLTELIVIAIIGILVIGPERLPRVIRTLGKTLGQLRRYMTQMQRQIEQEIRLDELNQKIMADTQRDIKQSDDVSNEPPNLMPQDKQTPTLNPPKQ